MEADLALTKPTRRWVVFGMAVLILVVLLSSRAIGAEQVRGQVDGFHQRAETDRTSYEEGDPVRVAFHVCRTRPWPVVTSSGGGTHLLFDWRVFDHKGGVVADSTHAILTLELRGVGWLPGQCRRGGFAWDQHSWNRKDPMRADRDVYGVPERGERVSSGTYYFEVRWQTAKWDDPPVAHLPVKSSPFQIQP